VIQHEKHPKLVALEAELSAEKRARADVCTCTHRRDDHFERVAGCRACGCHSFVLAEVVP
jgi:hypothetical protein